MKTRVRVRTKAGALLLGSGLLFGSGACLPDNFWMSTWEGILTTSVDTVVETYVLDSITDVLIPPAG